MSSPVGITIDNVTYDVFIKYGSWKRTFEIREGTNTGEALSGRRIRDILGTTYAYELTILPNPDNPTAYDSLFHVLSQPVDYHHVVMPYGQSTLEFDAAITGGNDSYNGFYAGFKRWDELTIQFVPIDLQRT